MRIGILGGTFNPVHNGHLYIAKQALKKIRLSKVIFIPCYMPPHKRILGKVTVRDRLRMLRLAIAKERRFSVSLHEIHKRGTSYSVDTLRHMRKRFGKKADIFFIIGADSQADLSKWKNISGILSIARFVVAPRKGLKMGRAAIPATYLKIACCDASSSRIRALAGKGKPVGHLVPQAVNAYIRSNKLYGR